MSVDAPDVSIIIVNWNTRELLLQCIESIIDNVVGIRYEVIVVDNASSDGSADAVTVRFPSVRTIASDVNLGFAAGNNLGIREAQGQYLLFLNPDTIVRADSIEQMRAFMESNRGVGAVGCAIVNPDETPQESYWMQFPSLGWLFYRACYLDKLARVVIRQRPEAKRDPFLVAHLLGACIMARGSIIRDLAGFDESYFMYMEETDLCHRISRAGHQIYYLPSASIVHLGQQSSIQAAEWTNVELYLSTYKFVRKRYTGGVISRLALQATIVMGATIRLALWSIRLVTRSGQRVVAKRMLRGYWRLCWSVGGFERLLCEGRSAYGKSVRSSEGNA